jgi:hypothetical protein
MILQRLRWRRARCVRSSLTNNLLQRGTICRPTTRRGGGAGRARRGGVSANRRVIITLMREGTAASSWVQAMKGSPYKYVAGAAGQLSDGEASVVNSCSRQLSIKPGATQICAVALEAVLCTFICVKCVSFLRGCSSHNGLKSLILINAGYSVRHVYGIRKFCAGRRASTVGTIHKIDENCLVSWPDSNQHSLAAT